MSEEPLPQVSTSFNRHASLQWTDICFSLPKKISPRRTEVLVNVSGTCEAGRLVCILGPTGAGKTSLLNILSGRFAQSSVAGSKITGTVSINGVVVDPVKYRRQVACVMVDECLFPTMTPREAFTFAADLRLNPNKRSPKQIEESVEALIKVLDLGKCADTFIGSDLVKGLSNGEKKRTAVGTELVTEPHIIFLDEPTSGLDSHSAYQMVSGPLKALAKRNKVVLCSIQQPSSETFFQFDDVLVLSAQGEAVYFGPTQGAMIRAAFSAVGHPCPSNYNPADHAVFLVQTLPREGEKGLKAITEYCEKELMTAIKSSIQTYRQATTLLSEVRSLPAVYTPPMARQIKFLFQRELKNFWRDKVQH